LLETAHSVIATAEATVLAVDWHAQGANVVDALRRAAVRPGNRIRVQMSRSLARALRKGPSP
jgi:hypothetical protein